MGSRRVPVTLAAVTVTLVAWACGAALPTDDAYALRWVKRLASWYPGSVFQLKENSRHETPSGAYRVIQVERTCDSKFLTGVTTVLLDEATGTAYFGAVGKLPPQAATTDPATLRRFLDDFLPMALARSMRMRVRVVWGQSMVRSGGVIPFALQVQTGYGEYRQRCAVTADGAYLVLGAHAPWETDPVAWRRDLLADSDLVLWDHGRPGARVTVVEFSDFECPGCKAKWPVMKAVLEAFPKDVRHGMVNFPLTAIHPWAFRAAVAGWCVASQDARALLGLKERFYALQSDMELAQVGPTARDWVESSGLDPAAFDACFLKERAIGAVLRQIALAHDLDVNATPTYFVNGWRVQVPAKRWVLDLVGKLVAGGEPEL